MGVAVALYTVRVVAGKPTWKSKPVTRVCWSLVLIMFISFVSLFFSVFPLGQQKEAAWYMVPGTAEAAFGSAVWGCHVLSSEFSAGIY